jgi:hypothetical protein
MVEVVGEERIDDGKKAIVRAVVGCVEDAAPRLHELLLLLLLSSLVAAARVAIDKRRCMM